MQLIGKLLVVFEELQAFTDKEWVAVDTEFKDYITGVMASYSDKYEKRTMLDNVNNYIVNTNHNAIKGANGRRYLVLDLCAKYLEDFKFFKHLREQCFNNEVGHAFYCYMMEQDVSDFDSMIIPMTRNKIDLCVELLRPLEKFLKFQYVLRSAGIDQKVKDVYGDYLIFCGKNRLSANESAQRFCQNMRELGFDYKTLHGYSYYKISAKELKDIATKKKWLHVLDRDEEDPRPEDEGVDTSDKSVKFVLKSEHDKLKAKLKMMEKLIHIHFKESYGAILRMQRKTIEMLDKQNERKLEVMKTQLMPKSIKINIKMKECETDSDSDSEYVSDDDSDSDSEYASDDDDSASENEMLPFYGELKKAVAAECGDISCDDFSETLDDDLYWDGSLE
jgi:transposase